MNRLPSQFQDKLSSILTMKTMIFLSDNQFKLLPIKSSANVQIDSNVEATNNLVNGDDKTSSSHAEESKDILYVEPTEDGSFLLDPNLEDLGWSKSPPSYYFELKPRCVPKYGPPRKEHCWTPSSYSESEGYDYYNWTAPPCEESKDSDSIDWTAPPREESNDTNSIDRNAPPCEESNDTNSIDRNAPPCEESNDTHSIDWTAPPCEESNDTNFIDWTAPPRPDVENSDHEQDKLN